MSRERRLIVVSNRLPVTMRKDTHDQWTFAPSSGGLVSALAGLKRTHSFLWIGWPGFHVPLDEQEELRNQLMNAHQCVPVFLDAHVANLYYNGFSNGIIWPLFHYLPQEISFVPEEWSAYLTANRLFSESIQSVLQDSTADLVWIHDYHLMMVPLFLRELIPKVCIGFFFHTPFPSSEVYRVLPVRKRLLQGVLSSNLIGFHTYDYLRHFLSSVERLVDADVGVHSIWDHENQHRTDFGAFPIGIDPIAISQIAKLESVQQRTSNIRAKMSSSASQLITSNSNDRCFASKQSHKLILGVDRLDYIKGVPHKLCAFQRFLERHPQWIGSVTLLQIAVPSRMEVEEYRNLRATVEQLVGQINGRFSTATYTPVQYLYQSVSLPELVALYRAANVCLVTSTRDGMNLVSSEFVAAHIETDHEHPTRPFQDARGILILSEFAGAAQSLGNAALLINPWDIDSTADTIHMALSLSAEEAHKYHLSLAAYVQKYTAEKWGMSFIEALKLSLTNGSTKSASDTSKNNSKATDHSPSSANRDGISTPFWHPKRKSAFSEECQSSPLVVASSSNSARILRDYLCKKLPLQIIINWEQLAIFGEVAEGSDKSIHQQLLRALGKLAHMSNVKVLITSKSNLDINLPSQVQLQITDQQPTTMDEMVQSKVDDLLQKYQDHTPGSETIKDQDSPINWRWQFDQCDHQFGLWQAQDLVDELNQLDTNGSKLSTEINMIQKSVRISPVWTTVSQEMDPKDNKIVVYIGQNLAPADLHISLRHLIELTESFNHRCTSPQI